MSLWRSSIEKVRRRNCQRVVWPEVSRKFESEGDEEAFSPVVFFGERPLGGLSSRAGDFQSSRRGLVDGREAEEVDVGPRLREGVVGLAELEAGLGDLHAGFRGAGKLLAGGADLRVELHEIRAHGGGGLAAVGVRLVAAGALAGVAGREESLRRLHDLVVLVARD